MKQFTILFLLCSFYCLIAIELNAQTPDWLWAKKYGGSDNDYAFDMTMDKRGNVFVAGEFYSSSINFDTITLTNARNNFRDIFVAKSDKNGKIIWAKRAGGYLHDFAMGIAVDDSGNSYVVGMYNDSTITFGEFTLTNVNSGNYDIFIVKYDSIGTIKWATTAGGEGSDYVYGVGIDGNGNCYLAGNYYFTPIVFGSYVLPNSGSGDIYIVKYNAIGEVEWANRAGGNLNDEVFNIATDSYGNSYITGGFSSSSISFDSYTLTAVGSTDIDNVFTVKYNTNGAVEWAKGAGGDSDERGVGVNVDPNGNCYVTGYFTSPSIAFGTETLTLIDGRDVFIVKYKSNGTVAWAKSAGGNSNEQGTRITTDNKGESYITGYFQSSTITFGSYTLTNNNSGNSDVFVVSYDSGGNVNWARGVGGSMRDYGSDIEHDNEKSVYITGFYESSSIIFGDDILSNTSTGTDEIFLAKIGSVAVDSVSPKQNKLNVAKDSDIKVWFNTAIDANIVFKDSNIIVSGWQSGKHTGTITLQGNTGFTFNPDNDFMAGEIVNVTLTKNITSASGDSLVNGWHWSFTVGVTPSQGTFSHRVDYPVHTGPYDVKIADLDNDGDNDIAVANYSLDSVAVLMNKGNGTFYGAKYYKAGGQGHSMFVDDVDNDGDVDLIVASNSHGNVTVLNNDGQGRFPTYAVYPNEHILFQAFVCDLNGDGYGDIITANYDGASKMSIYFNKGDGTFYPKQDYTVGELAAEIFVGDIDNDGDNDITVGRNLNYVSIFLNNGDGTFRASVNYSWQVTTTTLHNPFFRDFNNDGYTDMLVSGHGVDSIFIFQNDKTGVFQPFKAFFIGGYDETSDYYFISNLDGDGFDDGVFLRTVSDNIGVVRSTGSSLFNAMRQYNVGSFPGGVMVGDLDGDGEGDIVTTNIESNSITVLKNDGFTCNISGNKFHDINGNGVQELGDTALANWKIILSGVASETTYTNNDGVYKFIGLQPGAYTVSEEQRTGWGCTYPATGTYTFTLSAGDDTSTIDFGNSNDILSSIAGTKFNDLNGNGVKNAGEGMLAGWSIILSGAASETTFTDANGNYTFDSLQAGSYTICEVQSAGWKQTHPPESGCYTVTLGQGQDTSGFDFGNYRVGSVCGYVFVDHDSDGVRDAYIDELKDSMKIVLDGNTIPPETLMTDENGVFTFTTVVPDTYTIRQVPKVQWLQTKPAGGASYNVIITTGLDTCGFVFGNFYVPDTTKFRTFIRVDYNDAAAAKGRSRYIKKVNAGNVRDTVFLNRVFNPESPNDSGYLRVGIRRHDSADCYGWFYYPYYRVKVSGRLGYHAPSVAKYIFAKRWPKERPANYILVSGEKSTPPIFANAGNHLTFELSVLKTNIGASDLGITPSGLGDLVFDKQSGADTIFNGMTVREITVSADSAVTMGIIHCPNVLVDTVKPITYLRLLDTVITRINFEFYQPLKKRGKLDEETTYYKEKKPPRPLWKDTISTSPLRVKGVKPLYKVPYLKRDSSTVIMLTKFEPNLVQYETPLECQLEQNYPNPFNPTTNFGFRIANFGLVTLKVYDLLGREVAVLVENELMEEGEYEFEFDASNLASGVYFYRLVANGVKENSETFIDVKKMLLVR